MLRIEANGGVSEDGSPIVEIIIGFTVPLADADQISRIIKIGGTRAVMAVGAARQEAELAANIAGVGGSPAGHPDPAVQQQIMEQVPATGPHSVDGQCVSDHDADLVALDAQLD